MNLQHPSLKSRSRALVFAFIIGLGCAGHATAQQTSEAPPSSNLLTTAEIEERVSREGITVTEIDLEGQVAEVEGRDQSNQEIELLVDRRTGEILSRKNDD